MGKQILHMQIPYEVYEALKTLASEQGVTMTAIVVDALTEKMEGRKNEQNS